MTEQATQIVDPLDMPAGNIDVRFPRLQPDRIYRMMIRSPEVVPGKKNPDVRLLTFKLETTKEAMDTDGKPLHIGFKFIHRISVDPSGDRTVDQIKIDLGLLLQCIEGKDAKTRPRELINNPAIIADKLIDVKVGLQKEKDGYPESNSARFVPPA